MEQIVNHINTFQAQWPKSQTLFDIVRFKEQTSVYYNLYDIDRLEVALLEEGQIPEQDIDTFIKELLNIVIPMKWLKTQDC
jgi:predicted RNA-binding protein associated with RNAse of E/G family